MLLDELDWVRILNTIWELKFSVAQLKRQNVYQRNIEIEGNLNWDPPSPKSKDPSPKNNHPLTKACSSKRKAFDMKASSISNNLSWIQEVGKDEEEVQNLNSSINSFNENSYLKVFPQNLPKSRRKKLTASQKLQLRMKLNQYGEKIKNESWFPEVFEDE
jgi:uncharacterized protein YdbL (DUF1318 family)